MSLGSEPAFLLPRHQTEPRRPGTAACPGPPSPAPHGSRLFPDFFFLAGPLRLNAETCKNVPRARGPGAAAWDGPGPAVRPVLPFPRPVPCHPSAGPSTPAPRAPAIAAPVLSLPLAPSVSLELSSSPSPPALSLGSLYGSVSLSLHFLEFDRPPSPLTLN